MKELKEGIHYYLDEKGWVVLTKDFHLERGYCCGLGCRNCPYSYENVPGEKRKELRESKIDN